MASGMTPAKRFAIRASLVSGSTVALIVGAQTLITVDVQAGRMTQDGGSATASNATRENSIADSGISVIRQATASPLGAAGDDETIQNGEALLNQQQQDWLSQQSQLFNTQQVFRRPRTHSSR